jgi:hypothetical protein
MPTTHNSSVKTSMAPIAVRLEAAYLASLVWACLQRRRFAPSEFWAALVTLLRDELKGWYSEQIIMMKRRWTRAGQLRWSEAFG